MSTRLDDPFNELLANIEIENQKQRERKKVEVKSKKEVTMDGKEPLKLSEDYLKPSDKTPEALKKEVDGEIAELDLENKTINLRNKLVKRNWEHKHDHIIMNTRSLVR